MAKFVVIYFVIMASLALVTFKSGGRTREGLEAAARADTWSDLTNGGLTIERRGPLMTFWAGGRAASGTIQSRANDLFVAIDDTALVMVEPMPWPRRPVVTWVVRTDQGPVLRVTKTMWGGAIISESGSGLLLRREHKTCADVVIDLRRRGWVVDPDLDALPPPP